MRSAWQDFKAQPNKDKATAFAVTIATAVGVAYGAGVTPAVAIAYGQIIANELIAIGDKIGSMIPFSSAPLMSGLQKFFDAAPKCAHGLLARTAPHATVRGPNLAARVWNGTSPLVQRLNLEAWAMDSAAVQAEANAAASAVANPMHTTSASGLTGSASNLISTEIAAWESTVPGGASLVPAGGGNTIKEFSTDIVKKYWTHVFSPKHIEGNILSLGKDKADIINKFIDVILKADAKKLLNEHNNHIETVINSTKVIVKAYVENGKVITIDGYVGFTNRVIPNVIKL